MLKMVGSLLLLGGCSWTGLVQVKYINQRITTLRSVLNALEIMERELTFRMSSLDDILDAAQKNAAEPTGVFLRVCRKGLQQSDGRSFREIWENSARNCLSTLMKSDLQTVISLGSILGRYDCDGQRQAIARVRSELEQTLAKVLAERTGRGKVYGVLGTTIGIFIVILLL